MLFIGSLTFAIFLALLVMAKNFTSYLRLESVVGRPYVEFNFNQPLAIRDWGEKVFHGKTLYEIADDITGEFAMKAQSTGTSSGLYREVDIPISAGPFLAWEWKVGRFPANENDQVLGAAGDNDFAWRVYVIFKGRSLFSSDVIEYVWDERFPVGTHADSPFSKRVKILVVENGPADPTGPWAREQRDLAGDYQMLFGKPPTADVAALAIMSDSDDTRSSSEAYMKSIVIRIPEREKGDRI